MAFTDEQFDKRLSPMFRSMRPENQQRGPLNGLLPDKDQSAGMSAAPALPARSSEPSVFYHRSIPPTPSRAQMLSQPARVQYAESTPPAQSPQQVWQSPSVGNMLPPRSVTAGLIDAPADSVAAGMNTTPMTMPAPQAPAVSDEDAMPPPPEAPFYIASGGGYNYAPAEYLAPAQYIPLQPSRRYEVI